MSIKVINDVFDNSEMIGNDRLVMLSIADNADDEKRQAWPSVSNISHKTRIPVRTVWRCIKRCINAGELTIIKHGGPEGGSNLYEVTVKRSSRQGGSVKMTGVPPSGIGGMPPSGTVTVIEPSVQNNRVFKKPTAEEMIAHGDTMNPKLPPDECRRCWAFYESNGWKVGQNPMRNWQAAMINWRKGYAQPTLALNDNPAKSIYELTKIMEAKQRVADSIRMKHSIEVAGGRQWNSAEQKQKYIDMCKEIKAINEQISKR